MPGYLWTVRVVWAMGLEVATVLTLGSSPTGPAVNIAGDPAPGWEQAWGSGAQGPEKGSLEGGWTLHCLSSWALRSPVLCQQALAPPCRISPQHCGAWLSQEAAPEWV